MRSTQPPKPPSERADVIGDIQSMIQQQPVAMVTTHRADAEMGSRPMMNVSQQFDGELWFFANESDSLVTEIAENPRLNVSFADPSGDRYLTLAGRGSFVRDSKRQELLWNPACAKWVGHPLAAGVGLVRVDVVDATLWERESNVMVTVNNLVNRLMMGVVTEEPIRIEQVAWTSHDGGDSPSL